jgi:hypothetical protein
LLPKKQKPVLKADITTTTPTVLPMLEVTPQPTVRQLIAAHIPAHIPILAILALPAVRVPIVVVTATTTGSHCSVEQRSETQLCKEMQ